MGGGVFAGLLISISIDPDPSVVNGTLTEFKEAGLLRVAALRFSANTVPVPLRPLLVRQKGSSDAKGGVVGEERTLSSPFDKTRRIPARGSVEVLCGSDDAGASEFALLTIRTTDVVAEEDPEGFPVLDRLRMVGGAPPPVFDGTGATVGAGVLRLICPPPPPWDVEDESGSISPSPPSPPCWK